MGFNWKAAASGEQAEKMEAGWHRVTCVKVMRSNKDGEEYVSSKNNAPQVYTVWRNAEGQEALVVFTLSESAGWVLAQCLEACGADLERMEKEGVGVGDFENVDFAKKQLLDRQGWALCEVKGKYPNLSFAPESDVPVDKLKATPASALDRSDAGELTDEDIPF